MENKDREVRIMTEGCAVGGTRLLKEDIIEIESNLSCTNYNLLVIGKGNDNGDKEEINKYFIDCDYKWYKKICSKSIEVREMN